MSNYTLYTLECLKSLQEQQTAIVENVFEKGLLDQKTYDAYFAYLEERDIEKGELVVMGIIEETNRLIIGHQVLPIEGR